MAKSRIDEWVEKEVLYNQTGLVNGLMNSFDLLPFGDNPFEDYSFENVENLYPELSEYEDYGYDSEEEFEDDLPIKEVFSWFLVTEYAYRQYRDNGFVVLETEYGYYWGRTTFGQSITIDQDVIQLVKKVGY